MIPSYQIKIEWWKTSKDGAGNNVEDIWKALHLWADVKRLGGGRITANGQTALSDSVEFKIFRRVDTWPTGNYRIVYDGKRFTPQSIVKDKERKFYWVILANAV